MNDTSKMFIEMITASNAKESGQVDAFTLKELITKVKNASDAILSKVLIGIGILPHRCGYRYLKQAVITTLFSSQECTYKLYDKMSQEFNCTPSSIERAIRHSVGQAYNCGKLKYINKYFSIDIVENYHLTNTEIIALLVQYVIEKKPWLL